MARESERVEREIEREREREENMLSAFFDNNEAMKI